MSDFRHAHLLCYFSFSFLILIRIGAFSGIAFSKTLSVCAVELELSGGFIKKMPTVISTNRSRRVFAITGEDLD